MNNDKGNIGIITQEREIENLQEQTKILFKVVDKLEQRISSLEKVLQSHAKCIGEIREVITDEWFKILSRNSMSYPYDTR